MNLLLFLLSVSAHAADTPYCLAIRGNGEAVIAHWPAMAKSVEKNGLPKVTAGGSSATISMFFLDCIAGNKKINSEKDEAKKRKMQGLLLKSLPTYTDAMARQKDTLPVFQFASDVMSSKSKEEVAAKVKILLSGKGPVTLIDVKNALGKYYPMLNPELIQGLVNKPEFFKGEAMNSIEFFGKFDAKDDANLFFRPGLMDFKQFAIEMGAIGDFYAGNTDAATKKRLEDFTDKCADASYDTDWAKMPESCQGEFRGIVNSYLAQGTKKRKHQAIFQKVGTNIPSFPTTSVVEGDAVQKFQQQKAQYSRGDKGDYSKFTVDFDKTGDKRELSFGYWGVEDGLRKIQAGVAPAAAAGDAKSQKFNPLGQANWFEVLATSPCEPGLCNPQKIPVNTTREKVLKEMKKSYKKRWQGLEYKQGVLSFGGWSDLHPVPVIKAYDKDCKTEYLTRTNGDSVFGGQVLSRLTGTWSKIPNIENLREFNKKGICDTKGFDETPWNRISNLCNPQSSFNTALQAADSVYCTDWDAAENNVFKGHAAEAVRDSENAPVFLKPGAPAYLQVGTIGKADLPGCHPPYKNHKVEEDHLPSEGAF